MTSAPFGQTPVTAKVENAIRAALARAEDSPQLENSARLQAFLRYVVEQSLRGRGDQIVGKIIAQDVYGRAPEDGSDNIVRVDARRLRRALAEYYGAEGQDDPIRIHIDKGQYAPRFEDTQDAATDDSTPDAQAETGTESETELGAWPRRNALVGAAVLAALILAGGWAVLRSSPETAPPDNAAQERMALAEKSMATLQAANMSIKASELLFPIADIDHQQTATELFRKAIRIDPEFADGYAGAAHSLSTLALITPDPDMRQSLLVEASQMAERAVNMDPTSGWSISATAWLAFVTGDYPRAKQLSERAYLLSDQDGRVLDYRAMILLLTGDFAQAQQVADPDTPRKVMSLHQAHRNVYAVASLHLGQYDRALRSIDAAIALGGPVSELSLVYMASAKQAKGQTQEAKRLLAELAQTWPAFRPEIALPRFYANPEHANQVLDLLIQAGWDAGL